MNFEGRLARAAFSLTLRGHQGDKDRHEKTLTD